MEKYNKAMNSIYSGQLGISKQFAVVNTYTYDRVKNRAKVYYNFRMFIGGIMDEKILKVRFQIVNKAKEELR